MFEGSSATDYVTDVTDIRKKEEGKGRGVRLFAVASSGDLTFLGRRGHRVREEREE